MQSIAPNAYDVRTNIADRSQNSLLFENSSYKKLYVNPELKYYKETERNLHIFKPYLITTYLNDIKKNCQLITIEEYEFDKYYCDPKRFSLDKYGTIDFWYIILAVNDLCSPTEFKDFKYGIYIPDLDYVNELISIEEKKNVEK